MFERLVEFKRVAGHCLVPQRYEPDEKLALWVKIQRGQNKCNKIDAGRKQKLNSIGFVWSVRTNGIQPRSIPLVSFDVKEG